MKSEWDEAVVVQPNQNFDVVAKVTNVVVLQFVQTQVNFMNVYLECSSGCYQNQKEHMPSIYHSRAAPEFSISAVHYAIRGDVFARLAT